MGSIAIDIRKYMKRNETKSETCANLYARINEACPISKRAFELRFAKLCERNYATNRVCTAKEIELMEGAYPAKILPKAGAAASAAKVQPTAALKPTDWDMVIVRGLLGLGVMAHAALIVYEMQYLWGGAGLIASAIVFVLIAASVVLMRKNKSQAITENLMFFVWFLDGAAWFVHSRALYHGGEKAFGAGIDQFGTGCLAAVICLCAGALLYFYRETGLKK